MIEKFRYRDGELKILLNSMVTIIDSREQINRHITDYLDKHKLKYISKKLSFGDYACMVPANMELGIYRDVYFDGCIAIERKNSLEELSGNLTRDRARFEAEMIRASNAKLILVVENASYEDIILHRYDTQYDPKSFITTLKHLKSDTN